MLLQTERPHKLLISYKSLGFAPRLFTCVFQLFIIECLWASSNDKLITVAKDGLNGCKVNAVGKGSTAVTVTVRTRQGNEYDASIYITVTE